MDHFVRAASFGAANIARSCGGQTVVNYGNSSYADQAIRQLADQFRRKSRHFNQHEPSAVPARIPDPARRRAAAAGGIGICVVAWLQRIAGADEFAAASPSS